MKVHFKKVTLLAHKRVCRKLLEDLQDLGVLHLQSGETQETGELEEAIHQRNVFSGIIHLLEHLKNDSQENHHAPDDIRAAKDTILGLEKEMEHLQQRIEFNEKEYDKFIQWGVFTVEKFKPLKQLGYHVFLCSAPHRTYEKLQLAGHVHEVIRKDDQGVFFALITRKEQLDLPIDYAELPNLSPEKLRRKIKRQNKKLGELESEIRQFSSLLPEFQRKLKENQDHIALLEAQQAFVPLKSEKIFRMTGWFPLNKEESLVEFLEAQQVPYMLQYPDKEDQVPVLLKNSGYTRLYEPITRIFELPNYYETDLTPFIAVFYPILFAYCLGDAGYGFILAGIMAAGYFTFFKSTPRVAILGFILGLTTMVMGLVKSGSLFGITLLADHEAPWVRYLSQFVIIPDDSQFLFNAFNVALMIGVLQILTGIIVSIYTRAKYEGLVYAISPLGKLLIVISLLWIFLADMQEMSWLMGYSAIRYGLLVAGILTVMFSHEISMPLGQRLANSVMPLFFIFTGLLGDILSYVRLFALGLASSVLGLVVNQIGEQIMAGGFLYMILGILFLLFGHSLNFGIAALGSFVHPLRLTFVEFYGNAAFRGKGVEYKPYKKSIESLQ